MLLIETRIDMGAGPCLNIEVVAMNPLVEAPLHDPHQVAHA